MLFEPRENPGSETWQAYGLLIMPEEAEVWIRVRPRLLLPVQQTKFSATSQGGPVTWHGCQFSPFQPQECPCIVNYPLFSTSEKLEFVLHTKVNLTLVFDISFPGLLTIEKISLAKFKYAVLKTVEFCYFILLIWFPSDKMHFGQLNLLFHGSLSVHL